MDAEFARWLTTLGVGGVLAAFMFWFYRKDVKSYTELWKTQSEQLIVVVKEKPRRMPRSRFSCRRFTGDWTTSSTR